MDDNRTDSVTKGTEYELLVRNLMERLLAAQHIGLTIAVEHDKKIVGKSGQEHQIDVYWEYRVGGVTHRVAIECKNYTSDVKKEKVQAMMAIMQDVPNLQGVLITSKGFQSGAVQMARHYGIGLKVVREAQLEDYKDRLEAVGIEVYMINRKLEDIYFAIDEQYRDDPQDAPIGRHTFDSDTVRVEIPDEGRIMTVTDLINELPTSNAEGPFEFGVLLEHHFSWPNWFLLTPDGKRTKMAAIMMKYRLQQSAPLSLEIRAGRAMGEMLIHDVLNDTMLFVDESKITGDLEQESLKR